MAIVVELHVPEATRDESDGFDASMEEAMLERGGPPEGLMVHLTRPEGDGFLLVDVWRNETAMRAYVDDVILPRLAAAGLSASDPRVSPVWAFAMP